ncbi:DUF2891 domain-containing protein [Sodalis endosymbiont of Spalangia cameroni]|uniref:DUF2891 domain-containing protein n=1 Tax=Sodalis praecaptivus TaxID=1239307 RepID=UPI0031F8B001
MTTLQSDAFLLDGERAAAMARIALGHVEREYPNHIMHNLQDERDINGPRALHPVFFGSYDWHSCVHSYWLLARIANRFPQLAEAARALFARRLTPEAIAQELAYFTQPNRGSFERPYGWAWLLKLVAEFGAGHDDRLSRYAEALAPLADHMVMSFKKFWPLQTYPIRTGTHFNSAFAGVLALDYAQGSQDAALEAVLVEGGKRWFGGDRACQAWEPAGDEFLSPTLIEAVYMSRCLSATAFSAWWQAFLPQLDAQQPQTLFHPVFVSDRFDSKIAHLDGLNLSRAWCWRTLARQLGTAPDHGLQQVAAAHLDTNYMGAHWLATYALLTFEA